MAYFEMSERRQREREKTEAEFPHHHQMSFLSIRKFSRLIEQLKSQTNKTPL